jgi:hypothetical protein
MIRRLDGALTVFTDEESPATHRRLSARSPLLAIPEQLHRAHCCYLNQPGA